jgi:hypothetical protein
LDDLPFQPTDDLVAISNQYYEDNHPIYSLSRVLDRYVNSGVKLVVASGAQEFEPHNADRPLEESPFVGAMFDYFKIYEAFRQRSAEAGFPFPLKDTKNVFIQENAAMYSLVSGHEPTTLDDFLNRLPEAPYLPIWRTLTEMFTNEGRKGAVVLDSNDREGLEKWLRRRLELDYSRARAIASQLNNLARRRERLFDPYHRAQMQQMEQVTQTLSVLPKDPDDAYVIRLKSWLQKSIHEF